MQTPQPSVIEREIPLKKALLIIASTVVMLVVVGLAVGYGFFWNQYDQVTKADVELQGLRDLVKKDPKNYKGYLAIGNYYLRNGDTDQALKEFKKAEDVKKGDLLVNFNIGLAYIDLKQYDKAITLMEPLAKKNLFNFDAQYYTGAAYYLKGDMDQSIKYFQNALMFNEASADTNVWLGKCYYKKGDRTKALEHVNKALRMVPDYDEALAVKKAIDEHKPVDI